MNTQDYSAKEKYAIIKMRHESILIYDDKFVISRLHEDGSIDFQTTPKRRRFRLIWGALLLLLLIVFVFLPLQNMDAKFMALIHGLIFFLFGAFIVYYFYECFYFSNVSEIQKDKVTNIRHTKTRNIVIEFRDGKRNKKRAVKIALPAEKQERELALQLLRDNNVSVVDY